MNVPAWLLVFILATLGSPQCSKNFAVQGANLVDDVCKKTSFYSLCLKTLKSDPRSPKSDVRGLNRIIYEAGLRYANGTLARVQAILRLTKQKELTSSLTECANLYGFVVDSALPTIIRGLAPHGDFDKVYGSAVDAEDGVKSCHDAFKGSPYRSSKVESWNDHMLHLAYLGLEILTGQKLFNN